MRSGEGIRLLLVEDDEDFGDALVLRLEKRAFQLVWARTAEDALRRLKDGAFDAIVSDIKLPETDGMEFLARVREMGLDVPVIVLTGYGNLETAQEAVRLDAFDYLLKPLDTLDDLLDPIRKAVHGHRLRMENVILVKELVEARETEQRRIGRDLHDGVCQSLTALAFMSQGLTQRLSAGPAGEAETSARITELLEKAVAETRSLAEGLCPVTLETDGLADALVELSENCEKLYCIHCRVTCDETVSIDDPITATHLYRIAQEAVSNAVKHGKATEVFVTLSVDDSAIALKVEDNGRAYQEKSEESGGMGSHIIRHRAELIGAALDIRCGAEGGAVLTCFLPEAGTWRQEGKKG